MMSAGAEGLDMDTVTQKEFLTERRETDRAISELREEIAALRNMPAEVSALRNETQAQRNMLTEIKALLQALQTQPRQQEGALEQTLLALHRIINERSLNPPTQRSTSIGWVVAAFAGWGLALLIVGLTLPRLIGG